MLSGFEVVVNLMEPPIEGRGPFEFVVGSDRLDSSAVEQDDAIGDLDRGQVVRDQERGPALGEFFDRLADQKFVLDIDGAGGLVEDQDGGIAKHGAGECDALPLSAGEAVSALADHGVVALRQMPG